MKAERLKEIETLLGRMGDPGDADVATILEDAIDCIEEQRGEIERRNATYKKPGEGWCCFHCGERFLTYESAKEHFGETPHALQSIQQERDAAISSRETVRASWLAAERELAALRLAQAPLQFLGTDTVEGKRIEEAVAHAVGRDTAKCALAAVRAALATPSGEEGSQT